MTPNVTEAVKAAKGGQVEFRAEKAGIVHAGVGKASFTEEALAENVQAFVGAINRAKPSGAKGTYIKKVSLELDHGPGRQARGRQPPRGRDASFRRRSARGVRRAEPSDRPGSPRWLRRPYLSETAGAPRGSMA